jgi:hypothetical protein
MVKQGLSLRTVRHAHACLHKALADACKSGLVRSNAAAMASPPRSSATRAPEAPAWTPEQLRRFLELTKEDHHGPLTRLAAMTGSAGASCSDCVGPTSTSMRRCCPSVKVS